MLNLPNVRTGPGVSQNAAKAIHFFERVTTNQINFLRRSNLREYLRMVAVPTDWKAALEWYSKAIANGEDLGNCERTGRSEGLRGE